MSRRQKPKVVQPDVLRVQDELEDPLTMQKLDQLKVKELEDDPPESLIKRVPEDKRPEVIEVIKARTARARAYLLGEVEDPEW